MKCTSKYKAHTSAEREKWEDIGYIRKSATGEDDEARRRLLQLMIQRLQVKFHCQRTYATPLCKADQPWLERDSRRHPVLDQLQECDGDMQGRPHIIPLLQKM